MEQTWRHQLATGIVGLIHPETHFTDEKAGLLREATYLRLRRHWQFINELKLFEIHDQKRYGVHVYGTPREPSISCMAIVAVSSGHGRAVARARRIGPEPGLKDRDGNWDLRPHRERIIDVDDETLDVARGPRGRLDVPYVRRGWSTRSTGRR